VRASPFFPSPPGLLPPSLLRRAGTSVVRFCRVLSSTVSVSYQSQAKQSKAKQTSSTKQKKKNDCLACGFFLAGERWARRNRDDGKKEPLTSDRRSFRMYSLPCKININVLFSFEHGFHLENPDIILVVFEIQVWSQKRATTIALPAEEERVRERCERVGSKLHTLYRNSCIAS